MRPLRRLRRLRFESRRSFVVDGKVRALRDPAAPATARQLRLLNDLGALGIVQPGQVEPIKTADAAGAIDQLVRPPSGEPE